MSGAAMPAISFGMIKDIELPYPQMPEQRAIINKLNEISQETNRLESIYQQKLISLDRFKEVAVRPSLQRGTVKSR